MADDRQNPFEKDQLLREATDWFVLMRGDDADRQRVDFERWLARGALHRTAYNRIANLYSAGKRVNWDNLPPPRPVRGAAKRTWILAMGATAMIGFMVWRVIASPIIPSDPDALGKRIAIERGRDATQYATRLGEIREVELPDGSKLFIDTDTLVSVDFGRTERQLRLEHGRARFKVAHEARPFIVNAGVGEVTARGTIFDVSYFEGRSVQVQLLEGAIDVKMRGLPRISPLIQLHPGQGIRFDGHSATQLVHVGGKESSADWPTGMAEFRRTPLADVVVQANRYATAKIVLDDPRAGEIKVSGQFRLDDPERLAQHLAALLGLRLERSAGQILLARPEK